MNSNETAFPQAEYLVSRILVRRERLGFAPHAWAAARQGDKTLAQAA